MTYKNSEGYQDATAGQAMEAVRKREKPQRPRTAAEAKNEKLIRAIRAMADAVDFEIVGRIVLMDKESGKTFW